MTNLLSECRLCPRNCGADRSAGKVGYCNSTDKIKIARASLHMWEEPVISGKNGSGTVFFCGCPLRCVFCQNYNIAHSDTGIEITADILSDIFLKLQSLQAENINLVTPTHFVPQIAESIGISRKNGLDLPIVYNTSSYENTETVQAAAKFTDIFLADLKYFNPWISAKYSNAPDYFEKASKSLSAMVSAEPLPLIDKGIMKKGVIVRVLCLPGCTEDSKRIIQYLFETYRDSIYISIMNQYTPFGHAFDYPEISRKLSTSEYSDIVSFAEKLGIINGFTQDIGTADESFIPDFETFNLDGFLNPERKNNEEQ